PTEDQRCRDDRPKLQVQNDEDYKQRQRQHDHQRFLRTNLVFVVPRKGEADAGWQHKLAAVDLFLQIALAVLDDINLRLASLHIEQHVAQQKGVLALDDL